MAHRGIGRGIAIAIVGALGLLTAACATSRPTFTPPTPDPEAVQRFQQVSPLADLDSRNMTYVGPLPPSVAPLSDTVTDELGDVVFIDTASAVARFGEPRLRTHVVRNVRLCARVEIQRYFLGQLRAHTDAVEVYNGQVTEYRSGVQGISNGGMLAGAGSAWASFGTDYGATYVLGTLIPGLANNHVYDLVLDQNDVMIGQSIAQSRFWYSQNDFWLDAMGEWCPAFINWVAANGQIVPVSEASAYETQTGPPASR